MRSSSPFFPSIVPTILLLIACSSATGIEGGRDDVGLTTRGALEGRVSIGPICPVEQEGVPCPVLPETYASVEVVVMRAETGEVAARERLDAEGRYRIELAPGRYLVTLDHEMGIPPGASPTHEVEIRAGETIALEFEIDTGIR